MCMFSYYIFCKNLSKHYVHGTQTAANNCVLKKSKENTYQS